MKTTTYIKALMSMCAVGTITGMENEIGQDKNAWSIYLKTDNGTKLYKVDDDYAANLDVPLGKAIFAMALSAYETGSKVAIYNSHGCKPGSWPYAGYFNKLLLTQ